MSEFPPCYSSSYSQLPWTAPQLPPPPPPTLLPPPSAGVPTTPSTPTHSSSVDCSMNSIGAAARSPASPTTTILPPISTLDQMHSSPRHSLPIREVPMSYQKPHSPYQLQNYSYNQSIKSEPQPSYPLQRLERIRVPLTPPQFPLPPPQPNSSSTPSSAHSQQSFRLVQPNSGSLPPHSSDQSPITPIRQGRSYMPPTANSIAVHPGAVGLGIYESRYGNDYQPMLQAGKDIKRRTKTGCLTCRKRRIKCDELHPTCNNCEKSRRVCLGYDPLFYIANEKKKNRRNSTSSVKKSGSSNVPCASNHDRIVQNIKRENQITKVGSLLHAAALLNGFGDNVQESNAWFGNRANQLQHSGHDNWTQVCSLFRESISPVLDNLFATKRFSTICQGFKENCLGNQDLAIIEATRRLISTFLPGQSPCLYQDDIKDQKLEELRISNDYKLIRAVVQLLRSSSEVAILPVGEQDNEIMSRVQILNRLIHGAAAGIRPEDVGPVKACNDGFASNLAYEDITEIITPSLASNTDQVWRLLKYILRSGKFNSTQIEQVIALPIENEINSVLVLIGMLYYLHYHHSANDHTSTQVRMRLVEKLPSDFIIRRISKLCLDPI